MRTVLNNTVCGNCGKPSQRLIGQTSASPLLCESCWNASIQPRRRITTDEAFGYAPGIAPGFPMTRRFVSGPTIDLETLAPNEVCFADVKRGGWWVVSPDLHTTPEEVDAIAKSILNDYRKTFEILGEDD